MYLAKLQEKPVPNVVQKTGLNVFLRDNVEVNDLSSLEEGEIREVTRKLPLQITMNKTDYDRDATIKLLRSKNVFKVVHEETPSKMNRLIDSIVEYESDEDDDINIPTVIEEEEEEELVEIQNKNENVEDESEEEEGDKDDEKYTTKDKSRTVVIKKSKQPTKDDITSTYISKDIALDGVSIKKRLPADTHTHNIRTSSYYMNNRKKFIGRLAPLFDKHKQELRDEDKVASCDSGASEKQEFKLMIHQKVVSDYLNLHTPYRGLLLYHGLGSGKTCTSIAIAEGMKSQKPIIVFTLASLKANFFEQMKVCGDPIYRLDQFWEFISIEGRPDYIPVLSKYLSLEVSSIKKNKGAWMVNVTKESNFNDLNDEDKKSIDKQLDLMIRAKYTDYNYNGLNENVMKIMTKDGKINPFDNSVVVIDEAHNFVSMIVNKMKEKKSISYRLYEYLMSATNARIVLLSGTPIINYPNEIGIMFNILRGYIKTWSFPIKIIRDGVRPSRDKIIEWLEAGGMTQFDYVDFSGDTVTITRNPFGFINKQRAVQQTVNKGVITKGITKSIRPKTGAVTKKVRYADKAIEGGSFIDYNGVVLDETGNMSDMDFRKMIVNILNKNGLQTNIPSKIIPKNNTSLPDDSKEFLNTFVELDTSDMKNKHVFQKRILGLTSYFKGANDSLYPSFVPSTHDNVYHIEKVPMSVYQFGVYEKIREDEARKEKASNKRKTKKAAQGAAEDLFQGTSSYRIGSRLACNFAMPDPPGRPQKQDGEELDGEEPDLDTENPVKKITKLNKKKGGGGDDDELQEPIAKTKLHVLGDMVLKDIVDVEPEFVKVADNGDYQRRISHVLKEMYLRRDELLAGEGLAMYSPKLAKILDNVNREDNVGLHLIYSQFRTLEGIALMKMTLEANGYAEFKIHKVLGTNDWEIVEREEDVGKPKFALHTGTESDEEKKILLDIYNSKWEKVPAMIVGKLKEQEKENNFMGEVVKVLMITSSGAEGINLKNTRFVHLMEPYWHMVRLQQVIGRARRICSHQDLPEELRTVQVFLYMSVISDENIDMDKHKDIRLRDVSRLTNRMASDLDESTMLGRYVRHLDNKPSVITTDQRLFERALEKDQVNTQILTAVKEAAMDCTLYDNKDENLTCYSFGQVSTNAFGSQPTLKRELEDKDVKETETVVSSYREYTHDGTTYVQDKRTDELYNMGDYRELKAHNITMYPIGKVVQDKVRFYKK